MEASDAVAGHEPVMLKEVLDFLGPGPGKEFLDLTLGGGGHAEAVLRKGLSDPDPFARLGAEEGLEFLRQKKEKRHV